MLQKKTEDNNILDTLNEKKKCGMLWREKSVRSDRSETERGENDSC